jgi:prepilin-type N-terminal cleavage/methylation domain-containing protein
MSAAKFRGPIRHNQRGFTLLEMLGVIAAIAVLSYFIGSSLYTGQKGGQADQEAKTTVSIYNAMLGLKKGGTYGAPGADLSGVLIEKAKFPTSYNLVPGAVTNTYNGAVTVLSQGGTASLTQAGLPQDACIAIASLISTQGTADVQVNGTDLGTSTIPDATAKGSCTKTGNANSVAANSLQ